MSNRSAQASSDGPPGSYASAAAKPVTIPEGHVEKGTFPHDAHQQMQPRHAEAKHDAPAMVNGSMHGSTSKRASTQLVNKTKSTSHHAGAIHSSRSSTRTHPPSSFDARNVPQSLGFLGEQLQWLAGLLEERLRKLADQPDWAGAVARQILTQGLWVEEHLEEEWALRKEMIGGIDNMWILLSSVSRFNPVCTATFVFKGKVDPKSLEGVIGRQVDTFPKYKQILRNRGRRFHGSVFVDDPHWNISRHIVTDSLPEPAGSKELDDYTARLIAKEWDFEKPLWEMVVIDNYKGDDVDGSAIITRGHHTLTDGQGFVMSQLYISSFGDELEKLLSEGKATISSARRGTAKPSKLHKGLRFLDRFENNLLLQIAMFVLFWLFAIVSSIAEFLGGIKQGLNFSMYFLTDSWRARHLTSDYIGDRVVEREFATSRAVPMSDVRKLQRAFSGPKPGGWVSRAFGRKQVSWWGHLTLNDILVTVIADVMADEIEHQEQVRLPTIGARIREVADYFLAPHLALMIPISIRPVANWEMRNWSTGSVVWLRMPDGGKHGLPLSARAMHARLHDVSKRLKVLKNSILPTLTFWSVQLTGQAPVLFPSPLWVPLRSIVAFFLELVLTSFSAVVTNVPGPPGKEGIEFADSPVVRWAASPPQAGKGTLGIGIISYADSICITIAADYVANSPSEGVARRLTDKFATRWQQYLDSADDILARRGVKHNKDR